MRTNDMNKKYLVFIPVYNEKKSIRDILDQVRHLPDDLDILVIDDGSTDTTPSILREITGIQVIYHGHNKGYGQTLIDGFEYAIRKGYEYIITIDSDKQHQPGEISKFIEASEARDDDIISGSRYLKPSQDAFLEAPEDRIRVNRRITEHINRLTGYQLTDSFCGFKLYRVEALKRLQLTETGYGMPLQLWIQAWKQNLKVSEVAVELIYFDHRAEQSPPTKTFRRYRYYLQIIKNETEKHETFDISSTPR